MILMIVSLNYLKNYAFHLLTYLKYCFDHIDLVNFTNLHLLKKGMIFRLYLVAFKFADLSINLKYK
jgi:hypothetical protein